MRKRMQNKSHNHVKKPKAFSKGRTRGELTNTPVRGTLTKRGYELVFGHNPQTFITRVVMMLYLRDMNYLGYNIQSDHNVHTLNVSNKERY